MNKTKRKRKYKKERQSPFKNKWTVIFLTVSILSVGIAGAYFIAQSGGDAKEKPPSKTREIQGPSPPSRTAGGNPSTYQATVNLRRVYKQLKCLCGNCDKTLADLIRAFDGTQPVFKQSPPILFFSMSVTFALTVAAI